MSDASLFWLFLLWLTCAARIEEIGKARLQDVRQDLGVWFIDIDGQVKTEESRRVVPVHDLLIGLGFQRYREALIAAGHHRLFTDLEGNSMDKLTHEASGTANRYIDKHVSDDSRLVFHSFRHKFKDLAVNAGIPDSLADKICGHAPATIGRRYGEAAEIGLMHKHMMKIDLSMMEAAARSPTTRSPTAHSDVGSSPAPFKELESPTRSRR